MGRQIGTRGELSFELAHHCVEALNEQAATEGTGLAIAIELSRSEFLTTEDRDFAGDVLRPDEVAHLKWCRGAANHIAGSAKPGYGAWQRECNQALWDALPSTNRQGLPRDHTILFHLRKIERLLLRRFDYYERIITAILPEEFASGIERLKLDETRHIGWGKNVTNRLRFERADD
ncbi:MAG: hypothetical protein H0U23_11880, partial [Blastocatellia bacterium]|nr:hypothetical protein [Blastocatellia bacterium]